MRVTIDLASLNDRDDLFDLAGGEECWWAGEIEVEGVVTFSGGCWNMPPSADVEIETIKLDGLLISLDWIDALDLGNAIDAALIEEAECLVRRRAD